MGSVDRPLDDGRAGLLPSFLPCTSGTYMLLYFSSVLGGDAEDKISSRRSLLTAIKGET